MATVAELEVKVSADIAPLTTGLTNANRTITGALGNLGDSFKNLSSISLSSLGGIATSMTGLSPIALTALGGVASAVGMVGKAAFDAAVEFDTAFDKIRVSTGATGEKLQALEGSFRTLFTTLPTSSEAVAQALSFLNARLGLTGTELENLAKQELELARITGAALGPQLEATTKVFAKWEISTKDQSAALDYLFKVSQQTAVSVTDLSRSLVQSAAPLQELGFSFEQAAVLVGKFTAEGIDTSRMTMALKQALAAMAKEGVSNASEAFTTLITKIKETKDPMEQLDLANKTFGKRVGTDLVQAIRAGRFEIDEMKTKVDQSKETINAAAEATNDYSESWKTLRNKVTAELEPLGKVIFDGLTAIVTTFTGTEEQIKKSWDQLWKDLTISSKDGTDSIIAAIVQQFLYGKGSIVDTLTKMLADAVREAFDSAIKGLFGIKGPTIMSNPLANVREKINWPAEQEKWGGEGWKVGQKLGAGIKSGHDSVVFRSPYFALVALSDALAQMLTIAKKGQDIGIELGKSLSEGFKRAAQSIADDIQQTFDNVQIGKMLQEKISPIIADLTSKLKELNPVFKETALRMDEIASIDLSGLAKLGAFFQSWADDIKRTAAATKEADREFAALNDQLRDMSSSLPRSWNTIIDGILTGTGKLGVDLLKLGVKVKGFANDILNVFHDMPGKWGDSFRKTISEIDKWINFIDSAVRLIQRLLGSTSPTGLGGILSGLGGIFKKTTIDIQESTDDWEELISIATNGVSVAMETMGDTAQRVGTKVSDAMDDMGTQVQNGANKALAGIGKFVTDGLVMLGGFAAIVSGNQQGGVSGALTGALGGAILGAKIGSFFPGPGTIIGAAIGAIGGFFAGLFGGGKSAAQKEQERLQLEQTKISVQASAQAVINAAIQGFDAALSFFERLDEFTAPRKKKFAEFWQAMTRLMNGFLELSKLWAADSLAQAKAAAENIAPIAEAISALPAAFTAINGHFGVAQSSIDRFFADFSKVMEAFFARSEVWIDGVSKRAMKVANRLAPAVQLIANFGGALTSIADVKEPSDEIFAIFDRVIDKILTHVVNLNLRFEKDVLKAMANFAEKAGSALALWSTGVSTFKEMVDIKMPTEQDFANVFAGIERVIKGMTEMADRLDTTALEKASAISNASLSIFASIKAGVEALASLRDFTGILPEVFTAFYDGFNHAVDLLESMATRAMQFESVSKTFEGYIASGSASLAHAFTMLAQIMNAAGSFFPGGSPVVVGGEVPSLATGGDVLSTGLAYLHAGERVVPAAQVSQGGTTNVTVNFYGTVLDQAKAETFVYEAVRKAQRRGRLVMAPVL